MIDEYGEGYFLLSCDVCGVTEAGPFENFMEAVEHIKDNPDEWKNLKIPAHSPKTAAKYEWGNVCAGCFPKTVQGKWKEIRTSKPKPVKKASPDLESIAGSIGDSIRGKKPRGETAALQ